MATYLSKIASIKSMLAFFLTITTCILEVEQITMSETYKCIVLMVIGWYFGERKEVTK